MNFKELHKTSIQFVNPGGLMGGLNPEDLMKGNYIAMHRNKLLAEAFYLRGDIEKFGTGFFRIQTELQDSPEIQLTIESLNGFTKSGLEVISQDTPQVTAQVTAQDTAQVLDLIIHLDGEMSREEIQQKLKLTHRENFRKFYLKPSLAAGIIEMTLPDKPNSRYQKYRLTEKGKKMKTNLKKK